MGERKRCWGCARVSKYWICPSCYRHTTPGDRLALQEHDDLLKKPQGWWGANEGRLAFRAFVEWSWNVTALHIARGAAQAREQAVIDQISNKPMLGANAR